MEGGEVFLFSSYSYIESYLIEIAAALYNLSYLLMIKLIGDDVTKLMKNPINFLNLPFPRARVYKVILDLL